jgi:hypothetical protein
LGLQSPEPQLPQFALAVQAKATKAINATIFFMSVPFLVVTG